MRREDLNCFVRRSFLCIGKKYHGSRKIYKYSISNPHKWMTFRVLPIIRSGYLISQGCLCLYFETTWEISL